MNETLSDAFAALRAGDSPLQATARSAQVEIVIHGDCGTAWKEARHYDDIRPGAGGAICTAVLRSDNSLAFHIEDRWSLLADRTISVARKVRVEGHPTAAGDGFVSGLFLASDHSSLADARFFVPGAMYGAPEHVAPSAPGGIANYHAGCFEMREDQMAAPVLGLYFGDGTSLSMLDPEPRGDSTADDFARRDDVLIDQRFQFGAFGAEETSAGTLRFGSWFPGTRGCLAAAAASAATAYRRFHPVRDGYAQEYRLALRFGERETYHAFFTNTWRWCWNMLKPAVTWHDMDVVRRAATDMLAQEVIFGKGATGLPNSVVLVGPERHVDRKAVIGFTGKCLEAAVLMLMESARDTTGRGGELRRKAMAIIATFLRLKVAPPEAEGFHVDTGTLELALPHDKVVYLRSFSDDMKLLLHGYVFEQQHGREHPDWLVWCGQFADWLLTQQSAEGGFPRSWEPGTGKVANPAPQSSYNPIPMLLLLAQLTGDNRYRAAAVRAGEFCWTTEHAQDHFVGGTIDNPNVLDKEAATLSLEAYIALYEATGEARWLRRARHAADFAETFAFIWNVPMPADADDSQLHWKKGLPTIGMNVVSTGGPGGVDPYLAFDVDRYARLFKYTNDEHYLEVARLLLHNTKLGLAIPGRLNGLPAPGWQVEHVCLCPPRRGMCAHTLWLPWVSTCQLHGIVFTEYRTPDLFRLLAG